MFLSSSCFFILLKPQSSIIASRAGSQTTIADLLGGHHRLAMFSGKLKLPWWYKLNWRNPKVLPILFVIEFPFTVACLALFGIADPDTYRTSLWKEGSIHGWNSDPQEILYAYANYKPIPIPAPWNQLCVLKGFNLNMRKVSNST